MYFYILERPQSRPHWYPSPAQPASVKHAHLYRSASALAAWQSSVCQPHPARRDARWAPTYGPTSVNVYTVCYHGHMCMCKHAHLYHSASHTGQPACSASSPCTRT